MTWARFDDGFSEHPKVLGLSDRAFRTHVTAICYSARYLTDGVVPQIRFPKAPARELITAGLWEPVEGGYLIHDFLDYNPSKDQVENERRQARERRQKGDRDSGDVRANVGGPVPSPTPTRPVEGSEAIRHFSTFWQVYPRKVAKRTARTAFENALKRAPADEIIAGAERYRDDPNREEQFTAHASTWLNRDSWSDDPLPSRNGSDRASQIMGRAIAEREKREEVSRGTRPGIGPGGPASGGVSG